jgi:hypothetical protein
MKSVRYWSVRNASWLHRIYKAFEKLLLILHPVWNKVGYRRLDGPFADVEKVVKGFLFDSKSCGQCTLGSTGLACPMNCPKTLRNGPCGGVRGDGSCEVKPDMTCVWVTAWEGSQRIGEPQSTIQVIQPPLDSRLNGTSAWLREVRKKLGIAEI